MARPLRLATFNLESLDDRPGLEPPLGERVSVLRPQLARLHADILCLQEVNGQRPEGGGPRCLAALDRLLDGTPYAAFERAVGGRPGEAAIADKHNLVTLSRLPIAARRTPWHELVPPPFYRPATADPRAAAVEPVRWDRPILVTEIGVPGGRRLHLLNLHLRAPLAAPIAGQKTGPFAWNSCAAWAEGFFVATLKRAGQALEARLTVDAIFDADADGLVAVCGDFNAEERETPLRTIRADLEDTGNGRLAGRVLTPLERTVPESQRFSVLHHGHRAMLDHILVSRQLLGFYRHVEVHNETIGDELVAFAGVRGSPESYHAPVVAEFELPD
jgi:endonuclease/exonuclease/phosphatase family metal-dependent hydrolase